MTDLTIISGGQTGADRAALDFAIQHGIPHGGWCPKGRLAEDGRIADCYQLRETPSRSYALRTEWNVRDADATILFTLSPDLQGGTALTLSLARKLGKPWLHIIQDNGTTTSQHAQRLRKFLATHRAQLLNVAGPRASQSDAVGRFVREVLTSALLKRP